MNLRNILSGIALLAGILSAHAIEYTPANVSASIALKVPGGIPQAPERTVRLSVDGHREPARADLSESGRRRNQQADYPLHHSHREYLLQLRRTGEKRSMP